VPALNGVSNSSAELTSLPTFGEKYATNNHPSN
jgi:hypothetical protein